MQYLGDFSEDATVYIPFNTFSSDDPSASVTITNLVDADIKVHKDGSVTDIVTDGATVAIDFDTVTGNHLITIDTSASADYSIGSDYLVRIEGTTVDAGTINAIVGSFSIENRYNAAADDLANSTDGLGALKAILDTSGVRLNATQGATTWEEITLSPVGNAPNIDFNGAGSGDVFTFTRTGSGGLYDAAYKADLLAAIVSGGSALGGANINQIMLDLANGGRLDLLIDAIKGVTDALPDNGALTTLITHLTDIKGGTFSGATDSLEAIRDRGDAAWSTATGFATEAKQDIIDGAVDQIILDIGALNNISAAQVNAEVVDALSVDTYAESSGVPAATASLAAKIQWLATLARNKVTQTSTTLTLRNDADSGTISSATVSDDATTYTRGEFS